MNTYVVVGIFGIISNFVASLADVPLVKPGKSGPGEGIAVSGVNRWWADVTQTVLYCHHGFHFWVSPVPMLLCGSLPI